MDRFLDENESAASSRAGSPGRAHIVQSNPASDDSYAIQPTAENAISNRPTSGDSHYSSAVPLLRIPQSYVPTPVIVSNDKEPPAKKPKMGNTESLIMINGPPPLRPRDNAALQIPQIPHIASHATNHVTMTTDHSTNHMTNHVVHSSQLATGTSPPAPTSLPNTGIPFSSINTQHHMNMHNIDTGKTYARLTQNS